MHLRHPPKKRPNKQILLKHALDLTIHFHLIVRLNHELCVWWVSTQCTAFESCLQVFRQARSPLRVDFLVPISVQSALRLASSRIEPGA